jgi:hypothetical protein
MTKASTRIRRMLAGDPHTAAARALAEIDAPEAKAVCCHPDCNEMCTWTGAQHGPPPRFHTNSCRMSYAQTRRALIDERDAYRRLIEEGSPTYDQRAALRRRMQSTQMLLDRYPSLG